MSDTIFEEVRALVDDLRFAPRRRREAEQLVEELEPLRAENARLKWMLDVITDVGISLAGGVDELNELIHLECQTHPSPTPGEFAPAIRVGS